MKISGRKKKVVVMRAKSSNCDALGNKVSLTNGWGEVEYRYDEANR
jgi:hypothetical protein